MMKKKTKQAKAVTVPYAAQRNKVKRRNEEILKGISVFKLYVKSASRVEKKRPLIREFMSTLRNFIQKQISIIYLLGQLS
jgi:hypothetical protein